MQFSQSQSTSTELTKKTNKKKCAEVQMQIAIDSGLVVLTLTFIYSLCYCLFVGASKNHQQDVDFSISKQYAMGKNDQNAAKLKPLHI